MRSLPSVARAGVPEPDSERIARGERLEPCCPSLRRPDRRPPQGSIQYLENAEEKQTPLSPPSPPAAPSGSPAPKRKSGTRFTLRKRLTVSLMTVGLASLCLAGLVYVTWDVLSVRADVAERGELAAEEVATQWPTPPRGSLALETLAQGLAGNADVWAARLLDEEGVELASWSRAGADVPVRTR